MNFISLDFEKASTEKTSICAVGIAEVVDNQIISSRELMVRPVPFRVDPRMEAVHGLSLKDLEKSKEFNVIWPSLCDTLENQLVIAHNVGMDISLLKAVLSHFCLKAPRFQTLCTWQLAPLVWNEPESYSLESLAEYLHLSGNAHQAEDDARMCAEIALLLFQKAGVETEKEIKSALGYLPGRFSHGYYKRPKLLRKR